jgi:hypothetical protein
METLRHEDWPLTWGLVSLEEAPTCTSATGTATAAVTRTSSSATASMGECLNVDEEIGLNRTSED